MKPKTQRKKTAFDNLNAEFEKLKASNTSAEDYKAKFEQNEFAQQLVRHWVKETAGTMVNLSRTKALCFDKTDAFGNVVGSVPLKGAYEQAIAEAVTAVTSGTTEFNTATARAVERLGGSGVKVTYGSGVNRSLSAMIRQNLLYSAKQAAQSYDEYIGQKLGCDGFEVDAHSGCRSSHAFMQGKMYSYNGRKVINGVVYNDGTAALKAMNDYGRLHFKMNVILGVSEPRYTKSELERIHRETTETIEYKGKEKTLYEWKQTQRTLERGIHTEQQKANMYDAAGMRRKADECRNKAKVCRNAYDEMCAKAGLTPHPERMRAYKEIISYEQNFKAVVRDEAQSISFMRLQGKINAKLLTNTHNNLYISDMANLKPLQQHTIDKNISIAKKNLNIADDEKTLLLIVIVGDGELPRDVVASFNPIDNILRIHEGLGNRLKIPELQKDGVSPNNPSSTYIHEFCHWISA